LKAEPPHMIIVPSVSVQLPAGFGGSNSKDLPQVTCHQLLFEKRQIIVGLSNGTIAIFRRRIDSNTLQEQVDQKPILLEGHTGKITRLIIVREEGLGAEALVISASADRTVRIWDPSVREASKACVQTLRDHGGTVSAIAFCEGILISASTDRTIKLWGQDAGRDLMLYAWFTPQQTLADLDCWVNDIALQMGEGGALFVGDEKGDLSAYKVEKQPAISRSESSSGGSIGRGGSGRGGGDGGGGGSGSVQLTRWRRQAKAHALGISTLVLVAEEQLLITLGYDNVCKLWDSVSGAAVMVVENEKKCRFTAVAWDGPAAELLLGDDLGHLYFYSLSTEKCLKCEKVKDDAERTNCSVRDLSVHTSAGQQEVLVTATGATDAWLVLRDVQYHETAGHDGAVIGLAVSDNFPQKPSARASADDAGTPSWDDGAADGLGEGGKGGKDAVIYSASLDNTIRAWDPYDMATLQVMHETRSEISCLHVSELCDFVITGNDDGSIRLWNPDSGSTISLEGHTNTVCCLDVATRGNTELLLSSGYDGHVGVWDITKRRNEMPRLEAMLKAHVLEVLCLRFNPHNESFITAGNDKHIHVWSITSYQQLARLEGHAEAVTTLALDGNFLLSGSEDGIVHVWDLHSYMALASLHVHDAPIEAMVVVPDNGLLVSCSTDKTVRVWDYGLGREVQVWRHPEEFRSLALRRATGHVLAGTEQHHIVAFPFSEALGSLKKLNDEAARAAEEAAMARAPATAAFRLPAQ